LESYTSVLVDARGLEELYGRPVVAADREFVEGEDILEKVIRRAASEEVALLVVGDPFGATTHADLVLRARKERVAVEVVHNAGIMNAVGCCGLQLYSFGQTVSLCFWTDAWQPDSWYERVAANRAAGAHTLCLLDIKTKEQSVENLCRGRKVYEPPRFMTCAQAVE
jgi:diphthine synthase